MTTRVGAVGVEETTGAGVLLRSGGRLEAFPMPLGSERTLGLAGPYGTPLIAELPAPADPAGGVSCAKACPGRYKLLSTARTSAVMRDIWLSGNFNNKVSRGFPQARPSTSPCDVRLGLVKNGSRGLPRDVCFAPVSGHRQAVSVCPFRAINGSGQLYSITSSALASRDGGTVRPSALAVFRLMVKSNFVGCTTGSSAGVSPFRIRPT